MFPTPLLAVSLALLVLVAAGCDLAQRRIPNRLLLAALAWALLLQGMRGPDYLAAPLAGMMTGFLVLLPIHLLRGMGAGDVKLMATIGAFAGPLVTLYIAAASFMAGGVLALGFLATPGATRKTTMPYGPAIAAGTLAILAVAWR